jgi:hypothetical protein
MHFEEYPIASSRSEAFPSGGRGSRRAAKWVHASTQRFGRSLTLTKKSSISPKNEFQIGLIQIPQRPLENLAR